MVICVTGPMAAGNRFFRLILTVSRFNSYAIIVMTNCGDRAVEQLRTARFLRQLDPGFNRQFAAQKTGISFK